MKESNPTNITSHDELSWKMTVSTNWASVVSIQRSGECYEFFWYSLQWRTVPKKPHHRLSRTAPSNQGTKIVVQWNIRLCSKICHKVKMWSIKPRPAWKPIWFSCIYLSQELDNWLVIMPASSFKAKLTKPIPLRLSRGSITFQGNRYRYRFKPLLMIFFPCPN